MEKEKEIATAAKEERLQKAEKEIKKIYSNDEARQMLINIRGHVKDEMERFGFEQHDIENGVIWKHSGKNHQSTITIKQETNSLSLQQRYRETEEDKWEITAFGIMDPLFGVIAMAMDAYFISTNTRVLNDKWTHSNIISGTNGNDSELLKKKEVK